MAAPVKGIALAAAGAGPSGSGARIGIVRTHWNRRVVDALAGGAHAELLVRGVLEKDITVIEVPGAYELPLGVKFLLNAGAARGRPYDAVLAIGCLIKGETMHFEYICEAVTQGISRLNLDHCTPVMFGVLAVLNEEQALARAGLAPGGGHNHGVEWAQSALQMVQLRASLAR